MQTTDTSNPATASYPTLLATVAATAAILILPIALVPFLGLAASMLVLGFITALAIWTRRKRALIGTGVAFLAVLIGCASSFICVHALIQSRDTANMKLAQAESQLQTIKAQASSSSDKNALGVVIKGLGGNDITNEQANALGKVGEWVINWLNTPDEKKTAENASGQQNK
jgi:hypothetical protein